MNTRNDTKILHKGLSYIIQGCFFDICKNYGPGQKESVYGNLLAEYLDKNKINFEREKQIVIYSKETSKKIGVYKPDFVADNKIVIEIKASRFTTKQDEKQLYYYLRNSEYELGYIVNFSTPKLFIKRIVYSNYKKSFLKK